MDLPQTRRAVARGRGQYARRVSAPPPVDVRPATTVALRSWAVFDGLPVVAGVSTRHGGVSAAPYDSLNLGLHVGDLPAAVLENRSRLAAAVGLTLDELVFAEQSHGREVATVTIADRGRGARSPGDAVGPVDALVTASPDLGVVILVADCVPMVLYAPDVHAVACIHAGWRGTAARVVEPAIEALRRLGASPASIRSGIGPAIPVDRYQVGDEVATAARAGLGAVAESVLHADGPGRWRFDLWAANRALLLGAGLSAGNIELMAVPTGASGPFFSDRDARPCGRFAAIARLRPRPS